MNHLETGNGGKVMERQYHNIVNEIILSQGESQNIKISYGNYKVVEKNDWSWRYINEFYKDVNVHNNNNKISITYEEKRGINKWFDSTTHVDNQYKEQEVSENLMNRSAKKHMKSKHRFKTKTYGKHFKEKEKITISKKMLIQISLLLLICVVTSSIAYIVNKYSISNEFVLGEVKINVIETFDKKEKSKKDVYLKNTGNVPVYVRTAIIITWKDEKSNNYNSFVKYFNNPLYGNKIESSIQQNTNNLF